ncbi:hypothetical protein VTK73DRAFT_5723 [Phialemonium thermophilum]|uniref:ATP-dependent bile acid permease n=1 Tax=Phialemonium thermophilum TaxID=223376 RepID=A0ABR3XWZ1_9PEZI
MASTDILERAAALIATALVTLLSLPAFKHLPKQCKPRRGYIRLEETYRDVDGTATEESTRAYSDLWPRVALYLSIIVGICSSVASKVLLAKGGSHPANEHVRGLLVCYLDGIIWALIGLQGASLPFRGEYLLRFRLAAYGFLSSLLLFLFLCARDAFTVLAAVTDHDIKTRAWGVSSFLQVFAALTTAVAFAGFPRRPDVYYQGCVVDQQHTASLLSLFSYSFDRIIFDIGKDKEMRLADIPALDYKTRSANLTKNFLARRGTGRLWRQLVRVYSGELLIQWTLTLVISFLALFPQLMLYNFLRRIEARQDYASADPTLLAWVVGLLLSQLLQVGVQNWLRWIVNTRLEVPLLSLLQSLVFDKALKQYDTAAPRQEESKDESEPSPSGNGRLRYPDKAAKLEGKNKTHQSVINHMKLDSNRVVMFCRYNNSLPQSIFKLLLAGSFSVHLLGWKSTVSGLASACLAVPLSTRMSKKYGDLHFGLMKYRDAKAHLLTEALQGMRQIKYSALEDHWEKKILASRNEELKQYWKVSLWQCLVVFVINLGPLLLACVAFSVYVWENGTRIKASVIFTAIGIFDQLDESVAQLPLLQVYLMEAWTSCVRLEKYLSRADKEDVSVPGPAVALDKATVSWPAAEDAEKVEYHDSALLPEAYATLVDISLEFPPGKLSVISGKTGSGKSLLLAAILGEVKLLSGTLRMPTPSSTSEQDRHHISSSNWIIPSMTSFVSQTPWIESGTVQANILFGLPLEENRYRKVLHACALEKDMELLAEGDQTEVGPKGVTLSGGQRWRLALARALYSRAGIIVLDDVLSAVDAHVGRHIVNEALTGDLATGRTRILATHHPELVIPRASYLVRLRDRKVESVTLLDPVNGDISLDTADEPSLVSGSSDTPGTDSGKLVGFQGSLSNPTAKEPKDDEKREFGRVKWKIYKEYYNASGGALYWIFGLGVIVLGRLLPVARTWALKELSERASLDTQRKIAISHQNLSQHVWPERSSYAISGDPNRVVAFWMAMYVVLYFTGNLLAVVRVYSLLVVGLRAAKVLFERLTHTVLRTPLRWVDTTPSGRILNRFTSDTFTVDRRLAGETFGFLQHVFGLLIIVGTSLSVSPYVIIFGIALLFLYSRIATVYIRAAREVKRISSTSHSPIYDQFSSVLSGLSTIRAFRRIGFYLDRMHGFIDDNAKASWSLQVVTRWLTFRMGALGAVFVTIVATAVALGHVDAALAGFSLTFALRYTGALTMLLQRVTSLELSYNSAERVLEYAELETEPEGGDDAPSAWPAQGQIEVENITVAYADDLPSVLQNVSFTVKPGERIGIVGRTGAGKSTLAAVLFRLIEPRKGTVRIDGLDISTLKLAQLRRRLAIIPQDPFLFSGTLRSNLDMEGKLDDYDLLSALQRVHLIEPEDLRSDRSSNYPPTDSGTARWANSENDSETTGADPDGDATSPNTSSRTGNIFTNLSHPISAGGLNLSQGQRQLCCLARALLSRPKIVVLDEATSAVDRGTDAAIQASLRTDFVGDLSGSDDAASTATLLVIAHRLGTVADFDRVLVLDGGRVLEMGSPRELLLAGMQREKERRAKREKEGQEGAERFEIEAERGSSEDDSGGSFSESGTTTIGAHRVETDQEAGSFWGLIQRSADKEKLIEMILGQASQLM